MKPAPRRVAILGSSGSIGRQALEVVEALGDRLQVVALGARRDARTVAQQATRWNPQAVAFVDPQAAREFRQLASGWRGEVLAGRGALEELARWPSADVVLVAVVGVAGLLPSLAAIEAGKELALANKETLVAAGELVCQQAQARGVQIVPVDGEHSAIYQCLKAEPRQRVSRIVLTASGGPFLRRSLESMESASPEEALEHPTWRMGAKITVDSATLMNKALEVIEARWLFDLPPEHIQVVIHPQSVVHGLVEFVDGSTLAHLSRPDMRLFIQYALTGAERLPPGFGRLDWTVPHTLTFEPPDLRRFPGLGYAYEALAVGGTMPAVLNAANEGAVERFLDREIPFGQIPKLVRAAMDLHEVRPRPTLEEVLEADRWARELVRSL